MAPSRPPSVDAVVRALASNRAPRALVTEIARVVVDHSRSRIRAGEDLDVVAEVRHALDRVLADRPLRLINGTGVLLHTNLGRAPLHPAAAEAATEAATGYSNLELDLAEGTRGDRGAYVRRLLTTLTGAEAGLVVNNNAGALLLVLSALARDRAVPVSRGELIEIGGSYRLPELMEASGARMVEVGTTNRTRLADYERVEEPALLLKVHPSNYRVVGFTEGVSLPDLVALGRRGGIPVVFDAGSGLLDADVPWLPGPPPSWLDEEPGVRQALETGVDLVLFSGDKLLGGPQAGIAVGRADLVKRLATHPLARALRVDGSTLAGLTVTLELYAGGRGAEIPFWKMAAIPYEELTERVEKVSTGLQVEIIEGQSLLGAGSVPGRGISSPLIAFDALDDAWRRLLEAGIVTRREAGRILVDLRAVSEADDDRVRYALAAACR